jgi:hypothetical protein
MSQDISNDWAVSQWLSPASPAQLELWRAENHWVSLCGTLQPALPQEPVKRPSDEESP